MSWQVAIDIGGTFTDVVALDEESGEREVVKVPSTPADPSRAFIHGLKELLSKLNLSPIQVGRLLHGSTVATNAILEGKYSPMGLIVTRGYREMLECARQTVPGDFGAVTYWIKPPRVVPLEFVLEVDGRLNHHGDELSPLEEEQVRAVGREFRELGFKAIAVSLLHSYRNPIHERRVRELIDEEYPECFISISSDVISEYREFERTLTTCLNTGLMPLVSSYVMRLQEELSNIGVGSKLYMMKSSGGVTEADVLSDRPIGVVLSGPAAGVLGACANATEAGFGEILTLDMGGTSTDISLIEGGGPKLLSEGKIDIYDVKSPMIDMSTVGAGGGSIAWLSTNKSLRVGPQSAGASPGPICYGKGGTEPTVTDANLVLGRISPYLLGGDVELDHELARETIGTQIGDPLSMSIEEAADGILQIAVNNIAAGIRLISVQRGRDPRRYTLFAFGGAGGLHACRIAEFVDISRILVPRSPGATSAEGLLHSDIRVDDVITEVQREDRLDIEALANQFRKLRDRVLTGLAGQGFTNDSVRLETFLDIRYAGQAYELRIPLFLTDEGMSGRIPGDAIAQAVKDFHTAHDDRYGYSYRTQELVEIVNIGVTGFGLLSRPPIARRESPSRTWDDALKYRRKVYVRSDATAGVMVDCPVYERARLPLEMSLSGPAIIEQYDSTLVLEPGWELAVNDLGLMTLNRE